VPVGTHSARFAEGCRVTILTDDPDRSFSGTILPLMASGHAYGDEIDTQPAG
jgi:putative aminopeptidase FrvX